MRGAALQTVIPGPPQRASCTARRQDPPLADAAADMGPGMTAGVLCGGRRSQVPSSESLCGTDTVSMKQAFLKGVT